jgi:hypothetical protein
MQASGLTNETNLIPQICVAILPYTLDDKLPPAPLCGTMKVQKYCGPATVDGTDVRARC